METPLTPLEFARRARKLYADREAIVDGAVRVSYRQFFDRCDRWSAALQRLGVRRGDRVAYITPNHPAMLESFYAVPQIGAVTVPINHRLTGDDFAYIIGHSGARVICAHPDHLQTVDSIRPQVPKVEHFVALEGSRSGWLEYETTLAAAPPDFEQPTIGEQDLLSLNYTSGTTARPKGVMMAGYYCDPEGTKQAIRDGWFYSGDAAVVHPDRYLEIRDRLKDVIISGGENISSIEVEGLLLRHPAVQEVAVVGLPHPKWGESPHAFVVLRPGLTACDADLREFARAHLAHFKVPQAFTFLTELPKTATGKVQKYILRGGRPNISPQ